MKHMFEKIITRFGGVIAVMAVMVATLNANSTCIWCTYQPELHEDVKKLRKF